MKYHYGNNEIVEFLTSDVVKIIDYGRSYFKDKDKSISSKSIWDIIYDVDKTPDCQGDGYNNGYLFLNEEFEEGNNYYISSQKRNMSHDLRLVQNIEKDFSIKYNGKNSRPLKNILNSVYKNYEYSFGTKEVNISTSDEIKNVVDMHLALKKLIKTESYFAKKNIEYYEGKTQIGELHVWLDGSKPMEYISTISSKRSEYFK